MTGFIISDFECSTRLPARRRLVATAAASARSCRVASYLGRQCRRRGRGRRASAPSLTPNDREDVR